MKGLLPREARIVREQRMFLGIKQQEMADELEITLQMYQRYEYGERDIHKMPMDLGLKMCYILEIDPYELVLGEDAEK